MVMTPRRALAWALVTLAAVALATAALGGLAHLSVWLADAAP